MEYQVVVFELEKEYFGVDIAVVEGIIKMQPITIIPHAPYYIEGVINLRGSILPVMDLGKRFGMGGRSLDQNSRIVVIALPGAKAGMIVDGVSEVLRIPDESIETTPPMVTDVDSVYITGIAKVDERLVILLDPERIIDPEKHLTQV